MAKDAGKTAITEGGCAKPSAPSVGAPPPPDSTALGIWLRRYRRYLPVPLVLFVLLWLRPGAPPAGAAWVDPLLDGIGLGICALGQWLRLWAWGSNAAVGKWGVRDRGPYALLRHPLYAGNFLIVCGLVTVFNNPWAYPLVILPFAYLYDVITKMEEKRMHRRFGGDYREYNKQEVPRFLPALGNLGEAFRTTRPFGWGAAWRKEYESCCGWLAGFAALQAYEGILTRGWEGNFPATMRWAVILGVIGLTAVGFRHRKRATRV